MKPCRNWSWLVVPRKIRKINEPFPEEYWRDKGLADDFFVAAHEKFGIWWSSFPSRACFNQLQKMFIHE